MTNSKHPIRRPEDLQGLKIRVPGIPILGEIFQAHVELARTMDSPQDRSVMLEMALIWSRLAEYAAKMAARKVESTDQPRAKI